MNFIDGAHRSQANYVLKVQRRKIGCDASISAEHPLRLGNDGPNRLTGTKNTTAHYPQGIEVISEAR